MVDYTDEAHIKHLQMQQMQQVLADMQRRAAPADDPKPAVTVSFGPPGTSTEISAELVTSAQPWPVVPANAVRFATDGDMFAIEHLDREYEQVRGEVRLSQGSTTSLHVMPDKPGLFIAKAWSWRIRDAADPALRRSARLLSAFIADVRMPGIDPSIGVDTEELEADYYRMALLDDKEATLVARKFDGTFSKFFPLALEVRNPHVTHALDLLIRIWGRYQ